MRRLDLGYVEGLERALGGAALAKHPSAPFKPFPRLQRKATVIASRPIRFARDMQLAKERVKSGEIVTLISLSLTAMFHHVFFNDYGVWVQRGGLFGKSDRAGPFFRMTTRSRRTEKERRRVARQRGFGKN